MKRSFRIKEALKRAGRMRLKGSAAIEAAVIVPLSLLIIAAVLTLVLILHDRVIFPAAGLYEVMDQAGEEADTGQLQRLISDRLSKGLLTADALHVSTEETEDGITVESGGEAKEAMGFVRHLIGEGSERIDTRIRVSSLNGRKMLIRYKTLCDGLAALTREES